MTRRRLCLALTALLLLAPALRAEAPPATTPESVGLSSERLQRLRTVMQQYVDEGRISGAVTYVARNGRVAHLEAFGKADVEAAVPMKKDTRCRRWSSAWPRSRWTRSRARSTSTATTPTSSASSSRRCPA
jgi:CubicO group peptidase (beta-lactamase class C family)